MDTLRETMEEVDPRYRQLLALSKMLGKPALMTDITICDRAALACHPQLPVVVALGMYRSVLYWPHLDPNPWTNLYAFVRSVTASFTDAEFFVLSSQGTLHEFTNPPVVRDIEKVLENLHGTTTLCRRRPA